MRALVYHGPGNLIPEEVEAPSGPGSTEVVLRPNCVGSCFSDKHVFDGLWEVSSAFQDVWDSDGLAAEHLILGHEFGAVVEEIGDEVTAVAVGDRVVVMPYVSCGECLMCQAGHPVGCSKCVGRHSGLAELCMVEESQCYLLPDAVSDIDASGVEPMAAATRSARLGVLSPGQNVVIFGAEDFNLAQLQWARIAGAAHRIVVDPAAVRRSAAQRCGATATIDPSAVRTSEAIRELLPQGADVVFVSTEDYIPEAQAYMEQAYAAARRRGLVVVNRTYGSGPWGAADPLVPLVKELTIRFFGLFYSSEPALGGRARGDYQMTLDYLARGELSTEIYEPKVVDFWSLDSREQAQELFALMPYETTKVICRVNGEDTKRA